MAYAKKIGPSLYNIAKRNGVAMRTISKYSDQSNINAGLVGWWKFDESAGNSTVDSSGNGITGTLVNSPAWVSGKLNNALQFVRASSMKVTLASNSALAMGSNSFTFAAWIYADSYASWRWHGVIGAAGGGASVGIASTAAGYIKLTKANAADFASGTKAVATGVWHHIACVMDRSGLSLKYYLDGVAETITYSSTTFNAGAQTNLIGSRVSTGDYFDGKIDDVRIYNRALSADDVTALYNVTAL